MPVLDEAYCGGKCGNEKSPETSSKPSLTLFHINRQGVCLSKWTVHLEKEREGMVLMWGDTWPLLPLSGHCSDQADPAEPDGSDFSPLSSLPSLQACHLGLRGASLSEGTMAPRRAGPCCSTPHERDDDTSVPTGDI